MISDISPSTLSSPQSVLGFTKNAIQKLNEDRALLDQYIQQQKSKIDDIHQRNEAAYEQETQRINDSMKDLRNIQRRRGIGKCESFGSSINDDEKEKHDNSDFNGIVQQKQSWAEKQIEVERQLANLHLKQKEAQRRFNVTSEEEKVAFTKAEEVRKSKERIEKSKQVTVEELTIAVCKYRELGLDFVKGENNALLFNFTKIDRMDCDRIFSFRLLISEKDDEFLVDDCTPDLREEVVMRLVEELNRKEDYPSFMRGMRKAFVDYVLEEQEQG